MTFSCRSAVTDGVVVNVQARRAIDGRHAAEIEFDPHASICGMELLRRVLATISVVLFVVMSIALIDILSPRYSLFYLAVSAIVVLPVAAWFGRRDLMAVLCLGTAAVLALSPVDLVIRQEDRASLRLRFLPVSHGIGCPPDTDCRGCIVSMNEPKFAIVLRY